MGFVSAVYYSNWLVYGAKHFVTDLPLDRLSHVFYAFMKIDPATGTVSLSDPWADLEMPMRGDMCGSLNVLYSYKQSFRCLKVVMSIGGWGTHDAFVSVMRNEHKTATFVESAIALVEAHHFDGIDIDWEYPSNMEEGAQLVRLLAYLRQGLSQIDPNLILTVAAPAGTHNIRNLHIAEMDRYLLFWNVMGYDFVGEAWAKRTGYHSNLFGENGENGLSANLSVLRYITMGVHPLKIVLGMPMYGRTFSRPKAHRAGVPFSRREANTNDVIDFRAIDRREEAYNDDVVAASSYIDGADLFVTYDSPRCVAAKARYVAERGLRGGFWWDSKGDTSAHDLVNAFVSQLSWNLDSLENRL